MLVVSTYDFPLATSTWSFLLPPVDWQEPTNHFGVLLPNADDEPNDSRAHTMVAGARTMEAFPEGNGSKQFRKLQGDAFDYLQLRHDGCASHPTGEDIFSEVCSSQSEVNLYDQSLEAALSGLPQGSIQKIRDTYGHPTYMLPDEDLNAYPAHYRDISVFIRYGDEEA